MDNTKENVKRKYIAILYSLYISQQHIQHWTVRCRNKYHSAK